MKKHFGLITMIILCFVIGFFVNYWVNGIPNVLILRLVTISGLLISFVIALLSKSGVYKKISLSLIVIFGVPYLIIIEFGRIYIQHVGSP
ncbi:hypothetical protein [Pseudalkalibacillus salsuginis]|uniref:hypothetical protein n=1 Tax=Pseudalkalibacillus salsuginis TaxID=2910972 RepID=UPI001F3E1813|nr:hypothetical protein [Pseudalkalibacillus salsuginis]MCF6411582.1 hypothetical protein [Pseudalkalibacillus salsuginis]